MRRYVFIKVSGSFFDFVPDFNKDSHSNYKIDYWWEDLQKLSAR